MTLDAERLKAWTKIRQKAALKRWLTARGVRFFLDSDGWPITTESALQRALDGEPTTRPNFAPYEPKTPVRRSREAR